MLVYSISCGSCKKSLDPNYVREELEKKKNKPIDFLGAVNSSDPSRYLRENTNWHITCPNCGANINAFGFESVRKGAMHWKEYERYWWFSSVLVPAGMIGLVFTIFLLIRGCS